jgi:penicillin-binding protein 1A
VTTNKGRLLYEMHTDDSHVLVAPWVAAEMTDLLQTAVATGTGRAAQIGRPVAGKTGTTSSNKDGWFLGFSTGITTGVWMGRDDARPIPGLQGGRAPARAFADFMKVAVAKRPVEQFQTEVTLPEWQLEPDDEAYYSDNSGAAVDENGDAIQQPGLADENPEYRGEDTAGPSPGNEQPDDQQPAAPPQQLDQKWLDNVLKRRQASPPR